MYKFMGLLQLQYLTSRVYKELFLSNVTISEATVVKHYRVTNKIRQELCITNATETITLTQRC